jgi:hypothetical protein
MTQAAAAMPTAVADGAESRFAANPRTCAGNALPHRPRHRLRKVKKLKRLIGRSVPVQNIRVIDSSAAPKWWAFCAMGVDVTDRGKPASQERSGRSFVAQCPQEHAEGRGYFFCYSSCYSCWLLGDAGRRSRVIGAYQNPNFRNLELALSLPT